MTILFKGDKILGGDSSDDRKITINGEDSFDNTLIMRSMLDRMVNGKSKLLPSMWFHYM